MRHLTKALTVSALAIGLMGLLAGSALADNWTKHRGDCDDTAFKTPADTSIKTISRCVKLFTAYHKPSKVKGAYKGRVVTAMKRLYAQGSEKESKYAKLGLSRLGVTDLPRRGATASSSKGSKGKSAKKRKKFDPPEASKKEIKAAERKFKAGFKQYKKKYDKALVQYLKMTDAAPGYAKGHYNVACMYSMTDDEDNMAKYLLNLSDMGSNGNEDALKMLKMARSDTDFADMRDKSVEFKRLTGYAKIKLLNAMGDNGEDNVENLEASLKKLNYEVADSDEYKKKRKHPIVWFAEHSKQAAYIIRELLNHPKTKVAMFSVEQLKGYDVVVVWGDNPKKWEDEDEPEVFVANPDDAEDKLDELERKQDEILSKPDDTLDEVEDALETPDKIKERVDKNLERPGEAVEKVEDTVDKVKGLFD